MDYKVWADDCKKPEFFEGCGPFGITSEGVLYLTWPTGKSPRYIFAKDRWSRLESIEEPLIQTQVVDEPS